MRRVLAALAARRSAIGVALVTGLALVAPSLYADEPVGLARALTATAVAAGAYVAAYQAVGRWEKAGLGAVTAGAASFAASLELGLPPQAAVVAALMAVGASFGIVPALPSTRGSAAPTGRYRAAGPAT